MDTHRFATSITTRLSALFTIASFAIIAASCFHMYDRLRQELTERDVQELLGKVELVRNLLRQSDTAEAVAADRKRWHDVFVGHHGLHLNVLDEAHRPVVATSDLRFPGDLLSAWRPDDGIPRQVRGWRDGAGHAYRIVAAWGEVGARSGGRLLIVLALDTAESERLLKTHLWHLVVTLIVGSLLAAATGFLLTRYSLRPVRDIARTASEITASGLSRRIDTAQQPEELKALANAFNHMLERLQDSFERLSDFSSDLAHELRTPINNLMGETQVALSRARSADELREVLASNSEEFQRLARMIDDMLFLARADHAQAVVRMEPLQLREEIGKVIAFFEPLAEDLGIRVYHEGDACVMADGAMLQRALANLLSNAIRHTPAGKAIRISTARGADRTVQVRVANEGHGIPAESLERVFDRFYRIEGGRTCGNGNVGLGLAIVKSVMELHGGRVTVDSVPERSTTFTLHLRASADQRAG